MFIESLSDIAPHPGESVMFSVGDRVFCTDESISAQSSKNIDTSDGDIENSSKIECDMHGCYSTKEMSQSKEVCVNLRDQNILLTEIEHKKQDMDSDQSPLTVKSISFVPTSSTKSIRTTQSHPKMSSQRPARMPRPPTLFKVGRTTRSLGSISHDNSFGLNSNNPNLNGEDDNSSFNVSSSTGANAVLSNKRGSGNIPISKQINSQDSLKSSNGRYQQNLLTNESPIDSKGKLFL